MRKTIVAILILMMITNIVTAQTGNNFTLQKNYSYNPLITNGKQLGFPTNTVYFTQPNGSKVTLFENIKAKNVTSAQLKAFIKADKTDEKIYNKSTYRCSNVAEAIHNNAEKSGIDAAFVVVFFNITNPNNGTTHMLNMFNTSDKGMMYIDCTPSDPALGFNSDKTGNIAVKQVYQPVPLFPELVPNGWYYYEMGTPKAVVRGW